MQMLKKKIEYLITKALRWVYAFDLSERGYFRIPKMETLPKKEIHRAGRRNESGLLNWQVFALKLHSNLVKKAILKLL